MLEKGLISYLRCSISVDLGFEQFVYVVRVLNDFVVFCKNKKNARRKLTRIIWPKPLNFHGVLCGDNSDARFCSQKLIPPVFMMHDEYS